VKDFDGVSVQISDRKESWCGAGTYWPQGGYLSCVKGDWFDDDCYGSVNEEKERGNDAAKWC